MRTRMKQAAIYLAALAMMAGGPASATPEQLTLQRAPSGHLLVPVSIDGQGPYTFLFDTGASHTAISQPVAEALGFRSEWVRTDDVQSLTTRFEAERFALNRFEFAATGPMRIDSVVIPDRADNPNPIDGLLGADAIDARRYAMDFSAGTLTFDAAPAQIADGRVSQIGLLLSSAHLQRGVSHINVIIDSGSARSIINPRLARYVRQRSGTVRYNINGVDDHIDMEAEPVTVRRFQIGGLCIDRFIALQSELDVFRSLGWEYEPAMVLGMDVLRHATVTVDRNTGIVQIDAADESDACRR